MRQILVGFFSASNRSDSEIGIERKEFCLKLGQIQKALNPFVKACLLGACSPGDGVKVDPDWDPYNDYSTLRANVLVDLGYSTNAPPSNLYDVCGGIRDFKLSVNGLETTRVTNPVITGGKNYECFQELVLCGGYSTYEDWLEANREENFLLAL